MDEEISQRVFQQAMDIFIFPEIQRRKAIGKLSPDYRIEKAQIIFSSKSGKNYVRLNKEVKAIVRGRATRPINKGELVHDKDISDIEEVKLTGGDLNYGHITLLFFRGKWIIAFNSVYNRIEIKKHIEASKEFYESAKDNLKNKRLRPFYEDAFACAELFTKSILLSLPNKRFLEEKESKDHKAKKEFLKNWAELGNVKIEYSTTLSKLYSLRGSARYLASDNYKGEDPKLIFGTIKEMIDSMEDLIK
jgi:uncharacterized protein (UPF0332 family)